MSARKTAVPQAHESSYPELANTDPEWWVKEVPNALYPRVLAVRNQFAKAVSGEWAKVTKDLCNSLLREPDQEQDEIHFPEDIRVAARTLERFHRGLEQRTCPAIFKAFLDLYIQGLVEPTRRSFANLRSIIADPLSVSDPVGWVESQTRHLVRTHRWDIHVWIVGAIDRTDTLNARLALLDAFRAPGNVPELIRMEPSGIFPYDASRMWNLLEEKSWHFVTLKADDYVRRMDSVIEDAADQMRIDLPLHQPTGARPVLQMRKHNTK